MDAGLVAVELEFLSGKMVLHKLCHEAGLRGDDNVVILS